MVVLVITNDRRFDQNSLGTSNLFKDQIAETPRGIPFILHTHLTYMV